MTCCLVVKTLAVIFRSNYQTGWRQAFKHSHPAVFLVWSPSCSWWQKTHKITWGMTSKRLMVLHAWKKEAKKKKKAVLWFIVKHGERKTKLWKTGIGTCRQNGLFYKETHKHVCLCRFLSQVYPLNIVSYFPSLPVLRSNWLELFPFGFIACLNSCWRRWCVFEPLWGKSGQL